MEVDLGDELVQAGPKDARQIGDITADAFRDDPFNHWMFRKFAGIKTLFHMQARRIYVPRGYVYRLGDEGACMWAMPGQNTDFRGGDYAVFAIPTFLKCGPSALKRAIKAGEEMAKHHPKFPHAYLFTIGVRPSSQGKGRGRILIQPVLDACDREGLPAYLENSNPKNTGFYASCGFEQSGDPIHPEPDSPPLVPMLRQPRG